MASSYDFDSIMRDLSQTVQNQFQTCSAYNKLIFPGFHRLVKILIFYGILRILINIWRPFWWLYTICIEYDHKHDQWCVSRTYGYDGRLSQWKCQFWQGVSLKNLTSNVTLECPGPKQHKSNWSLRKEGI